MTGILFFHKSIVLNNLKGIGSGENRFIWVVKVTKSYASLVLFTILTIVCGKLMWTFIFVI